MRLRIKLVMVAAGLAAPVVGCGEPQEMVPVAPPGFEVTRTMPPEAEEAKALGEQPPAALAAQAQQQPAAKVPPKVVANAPPTPIGQPTTTASGLTYETLREGAGPPCKSGDGVEMHYTGTLADGKKFDSSLDRGTPIPVTLGMEGVIRGWDEGIPGMRLGEKRKLTIPPGLAYGERGRPGIPPNATLTFEVELVKIN